MQEVGFFDSNCELPLRHNGAPLCNCSAYPLRLFYVVGDAIDMDSSCAAGQEAAQSAFKG